MIDFDAWLGGTGSLPALPAGADRAAQRAQETSEALMPDAAKIMRATRVSDGAGGYTTTWAQAGTASCRVAKPSLEMAERVSADRASGRTLYQIDFPVGTDVRNEDRVEVGGVTYEIHTVAQGLSYPTGIQTLASIDR